MNDKNRLTLYLVLGLPGSGKSSFVESFSGGFGVDFGFCEKLRPNLIVFPERDFARKEREWAESRASILNLADAVATVLSSRF